MIVVICGGREHGDPALLEAALIEWRAKCSWAGEIRAVITGRDPKNPQGMDDLAHRWAVAQGIPAASIRAEWERHKPRTAAGPIRNRRMAELLVALREKHGGAGVIAIPGAGTGTWSMVDEARKREIPVFVYDTGGVHARQPASIPRDEPEREQAFQDELEQRVRAARQGTPRRRR